MLRSSRLIGNILIQLDASKATVESYFHALASYSATNGETVDLVAAGRFVDAFEKRASEWRIQKRDVIYDWQRRFPTAEPAATDFFGVKANFGDKTGRDISHAILRS